MADQFVDEVVSTRVQQGGSVARQNIDEVVDPRSGSTRVVRSSSEEESVGEGGRNLKATAARDKAIENALNSHDEGDADEGDTDEDEGTDTSDEGDGDEGEEAGEGSESEGDEEETEEEQPDPVKEWEAKYTDIETRNRALVSELEAAKATPKRERSEREQALVEAEESYVNDGSVPALRKFLGVILGAAADSKEVDAELAGIYADLTAKELNVPLTEAQAAKREAARARLALDRDKRERKAASEKPAQANSGEGPQIEKAAQYLDNFLSTKGQGGTSIADEYPLVMALSEDFDGMKPGELIARALDREFQVGTLSPTMSEDALVRAALTKINKHYKSVVEKIQKTTSSKNNDSAKPTGKKPAAAQASQDKRQSHGARTITNATASVAPATKPKVKTKPAQQAKKTLVSKDEVLDKFFK
jgi:hypothetical protein